MSLSDTFLAQLHALHADVSATYDRLNRMQSEIDREVSDAYHDIEKMQLDEGTGYGAAKLLQDILRKRRCVKNEIILLAPIYGMLVQNVDETDKQHRKRVANSNKIRKSLNGSGNLKIEDIFGDTTLS